MRHLHKCFHFRSSPPEMFCKKVVLRNFAKFTGRQLGWNLFLIMLQALRPLTLLKRGSICKFWEIFINTYFADHLRTATSAFKFCETFLNVFYRTPLIRSLLKQFIRTSSCGFICRIVNKL